MVTERTLTNRDKGVYIIIWDGKCDDKKCVNSTRFIFRNHHGGINVIMYENGRVEYPS